MAPRSWEEEVKGTFSPGLAVHCSAIDHQPPSKKKKLGGQGRVLRNGSGKGAGKERGLACWG